MPSFTAGGTTSTTCTTATTGRSNRREVVRRRQAKQQQRDFSIRRIMPMLLLLLLLFGGSSPFVHAFPTSRTATPSTIVITSRTRAGARCTSMFTTCASITTTRRKTPLGTALALLPSPPLSFFLDSIDTTTTTVAAAVAASSWEQTRISLENWLYDATTAANGLAMSSLNRPDDVYSSIGSGSTTTSGQYHDYTSALPILYLAGLVTSFSPCVWGLLPVTMSYISQATKERDDQNAIFPTLAFAGGLTTVFCSLGVAATTVGGAVLGSNGGAAAANEGNGNAVLAIASNAICLVMGLRILELIDIPLPSLNFVRDAVLSRSSSSASSASSSSSQQQQQQSPILIDATGRILTLSSTATSKTTATDLVVNEWASLFRTFLLGGSSALAASPCATPVLTSILAFVAANNNNAAATASTTSTAIAFLLLLAYSLGYATPLLLVAGTGGQALAKLKGGSGDGSNGGLYNLIGPWVTPMTGAILLWYGTTGLLTSVLGDPSLLGLPVLE